MPTCEQIRKEFDVGLETASKIKQMAVDVPVATEDYWRDLAEKTAPRFPKAKGLQNYIANLRKKKRSNKSKPKKNKEKHPGTSNNTDSCEVPQVQIGEILQALGAPAEEDDTSYYRQTAKVIRMLTIHIGSYLLSLTTPDKSGNTDESNYHEAMQYVRQMKDLAAELRQTETKLLEIRKERSELWQRDEVLASVGEIWTVCRGAMDKIVARLVDLENLPSWIQEVGGSIPENREARQRLQDRIRNLIIQDNNELQAKLQSAAVPSEDFSDEVRSECREQLAQELETIIERLRSDAD